MQNFFPFDSGNGANVTEYNWTKMAQYWLGSGVIPAWGNELKVYADSTGMQAKVPTGRAWVQGFFYEQDGVLAQDILCYLSTADPTNPRIDRIVLRLDTAANTILVYVLQGVPGASPSPPALTQNTAKWDIPLAQVRVDAGVSTIAAAKVTDERQWAGPITIPFDAKTLRSRVHAYNTAAGVAFTTNVWTKCKYDTEVIDNLGEYDLVNSKITIKRPGLYLILASVLFTAASASQFAIGLYQNGALAMYLYNLPTAAGDLQPVGVGTMYLAAGDTVEIYGKLNGNATTTTGTGSGTQFFKCVQIA